MKNTDNQTRAFSGGYTYTSGTGGGSGAPAGATLEDDFSKGSLDTSKWIPSNWGAPGGGRFAPFVSRFLHRDAAHQSHADLQRKSAGSPRLVWRVAIQECPRLRNLMSWVMRAASTSTTPNGSGYTVSGQISSGFIFVNNSQTEIDSPEIEGQNPGNSKRSGGQPGPA